MAIFADVQYCIYADIVGGWVRKSKKICWHNIGMVQYQIDTVPNLARKWCFNEFGNIWYLFLFKPCKKLVAIIECPICTYHIFCDFKWNRLFLNYDWSVFSTNHFLNHTQCHFFQNQCSFHLINVLSYLIKIVF